MKELFYELKITVDDNGKEVASIERKKQKTYFTSSIENFGESYNDYKGIEAINKLIKEKSGWCPNAFYRNDIGNIALFWGDNKSGLSHILKRRAKDNTNIEEFLNKLTDVIEKGIFGIDKKGEAIVIEYEKRRAIIDVTKDKNNKIKFLLTAFEIKEQK